MVGGMSVDRPVTFCWQGDAPPYMWRRTSPRRAATLSVGAVWPRSGQARQRRRSLSGVFLRA